MPIKRTGLCGRQMKDFASPKAVEMVDAYRRVKAVGIKNIRLGNIGVFARSAAGPGLSEGKRGSRRELIHRKDAACAEFFIFIIFRQD